MFLTVVRACILEQKLPEGSLLLAKTVIKACWIELTVTDSTRYPETQISSEALTRSKLGSFKERLFP